MSERNGKYHRYFLYHIPQIIPEELKILLYNGNHYDLIYPKRDDMKNKKLYKHPTDMNSNLKTNIEIYFFDFNKTDNKYVLVNYPKSENIYNEIYDFLLSFKRHKTEIENLMIKYPFMNYNQILSYFKLIYPERINSNNHTMPIKDQNLEN